MPGTALSLAAFSLAVLLLAVLVGAVDGLRQPDRHHRRHTAMVALRKRPQRHERPHRWHLEIADRLADNERNGKIADVVADLTTMAIEATKPAPQAGAQGGAQVTASQKAAPAPSKSATLAPPTSAPAVAPPPSSAPAPAPTVSSASHGGG